MNPNFKSVYSALTDPHNQTTLKNAVPARFAIVQANPDKLIEELSVPCFCRFYDQDSFNAIADALLETHVPIFVLGCPRFDSDRKPNIYFTCDDSEEEAKSPYTIAMKLADHYEVQDGTEPR